MSAPMSQQTPEPETTVLGTFAWIGAVMVLSVVALLVLSWLGPLGAR